MRIVAGKHRGRPLLAPEGPTIRPTQDRTRESLFNLLEHGRLASHYAMRVHAANMATCYAGVNRMNLAPSHHFGFSDSVLYRLNGRLNIHHGAFL